VPLEEYRRKRDFAATPEPAGAAMAGAAPGAVPAPGGELTFVIHKHAARALHYDLRLEMGGVLASWAVPKGPSYDTTDKHLAVHVEDHPIEYGLFEGVIPAGEYGGGTVMVWDRGTYAPVGDPLAMVEAGQLKFVLSGEKLVGAWVLVRMKPRPGEKREMWLLIKERDDHVRRHAEYDVLAERPESAATGRTMEEIAAEGRLYEGPRAGDAAGPEPAAGSAAGVPAEPVSAIPGPIPGGAAFQLATLADEAPDGPEWIHEVKYDGYRLRLVLERGHALVRTRNGADWTDRFAPIVRAAEAFPVASALIDGEAVVFDEGGRPDFGLLQDALAAKRPETIAFAAFDLLYLDGFDLRGEPLVRRKELLRSLLEAAPPGGPFRYVEHFAGGGPVFHASACELLLEGSVSKRGDRPWVPGRSRDWIKAKCLARQEFVVGGWTDPAGSRSGFGALLLGVHDASGALRYAGRVGTGFTERTLADIRERLEALASDAPAFADPPRSRGVHWTRPELVAEVRFREWTRDGVVRQPSFVGLREDADVAAVTREDAVSSAVAVRPLLAPEPGGGPLTVAGVTISNPDKVLDPAGLTKGDIARYYDRVSPAMLPHLAGRLLTSVRCPHGPGGGPGECFYQKHPEPRGWPKALHAVPVRDKSETLDYFYIDDAEGLLSLVQLGVLEIHAWNSLAEDYDRPDRLVFDLDPGEGVTFGEVFAAARTIRDALGAFGLAAFAKTTGGHGLHVIVPIQPALAYDEARAWSHAFVERLAAQDPGRFTAKMAKATRPGRVFVDYLRNAHGATAVCAFSTRARPGGPVSVPVSWSELEAGIDPRAFTIQTVPERLERLGPDPWAGYEAGRRPLTPALFAALDLGPPA
jgi:bifunctional non-homologous end joining protein LigD